MSNSPTFRIVAILAVTLLLSACVSRKNGNFNRQKYTMLKKIELHQEPATNGEFGEVIDSFVPSVTGQSLAEDNAEQVSFEQDHSFAQDLAHETDLTPIETANSTNENSTPSPVIIPFTAKDRPGDKDFKTFPQEEKNQAIIQFNALFNAGLGMLITAAILFIFAGVLSFGPYSFIIFGCVILACIFLFAAWIISLVALNKVRRIKKANFVGDLGVKVWLARLVAFIGIATCIITLLGGILLGLLYLARLI
jgi:hypothetical protein